MRTLAQIADLVREAGKIAADYQQGIDFLDREYKDDGSVVTVADRKVEDFLCSEIGKLVPKCNFVTEEHSRAFSPEARLTFAIDPIDGTDNFSNGMHNWSLSLALLDGKLRPIGGIVFAPRLDLFFFADIGCSAYLGRRRLRPPAAIEELTKLSGIMMSSRIHQQLDMRAYPGKARALGSAALNLCMPAVYPSVVGAIQDDKAFAWDIAGAHAILTSVGCAIRYFDGREVNYEDMRANNWRVLDFLVAGKPGALGHLMKCIAKIS